MKPEEDAHQSIVDELVHQFTDPFAFYRELIQNSIDAGSTRIEVTLSFRPGATDGLLLACVADWGEGMNRRIIEDYLVTKFRSTKENDFTKIGKFGIGFVSVFACQPDAVTVDTGRDGESWRVLFRKDTTWELLQPKEPVEGTRVTVHKQLSAHAYQEFVEHSRASVQRWCRHSEAEVVFSAGAADGSAPPPHAPVREPLAVDAPFQVQHLEEGTQIVAGPARAAQPLTGFYNRGLTLLETTEPLVEGVALKIVSRYLEHTLTRDNVRRDKHFGQALALARRLVDGPLRDQLPGELRAAADRPSGMDDWTTLFHYAVGRLPATALWYRQTGGGAVSHAELQRAVNATGALLVSLEPTPTVERLRNAGRPVLELAPFGPLAAAVKTQLRAKQAALADGWATYAEPPAGPQPPGFSAALTELLGAAGAKTTQAAVTEVRGAAKQEPMVLVERLGQPIEADVARGSPFSRQAPPVLCLNRAHPSIAAAEPLFATAPRLAAVLMARLVLVRWSKLDDAADRRLTEWALA